MNTDMEDAAWSEARERFLCVDELAQWQQEHNLGDFDYLAGDIDAFCVMQWCIL